MSTRQRILELRCLRSQHPFYKHDHANAEAAVDAAPALLLLMLMLLLLFLLAYPVLALDSAVALVVCCGSGECGFLSGVSKFSQKQEAIAQAHQFQWPAVGRDQEDG